MNEKYLKSFSFSTLLVFFIIDYLSRSSLLSNVTWFSELGIIEISGAAFLLLCVLTTIASIVKSDSHSNKGYYIRLLMFSAVLFEELSFIGEGSLEFLKAFNIQNEPNLHNSKIMSKHLFGGINILDFQIDVSYATVITALSLFLIAYGGLIFKARWLQPFFCVKELRIYMAFYFVNLTASLFLRNYNSYGDPHVFLLRMELQETFIYFVMLLDSLSHALNARKPGYAKQQF